MATLTWTMLLLLFLACMGTAAFVEVLRRAQLDLLDEMGRMIQSAHEQKAAWEERHAELGRKEAFVNLVQAQKTPPVPGWFLAYLGEAVPENLVLTGVDIARTNGVWAVRLEGAVQSTTNPIPSEVCEQTISSFTNSLASGPFRMEVTRSPLDSPEDGIFARTLPPRVRTFMPVTAKKAAAVNPHFVVEGIVR